MIYIVITFYCIYCTYRIFIRKQKNIKDTNITFIKWRKLDNYWMYMLSTFALISCISLFSYFLTKDDVALYVGILAPLSVVFFLNALLHYIMNDYKILQDITALNEKIKRHNTRMDKIKLKAKDIEQKI